MAERIIVMNDTQEILELFRLLLEEEAGYEVVLYSYAIMDMREVVRIKPDLVILDFIFGQENLGWQMLQKLRMNRLTAKIPVIVCTAATREIREIEGYLQAQAIRVVPKPLDIDTLLEAVALALRVDPTHAAMTLPEPPPRESPPEAGDD
jgi:DNA-binding response OmpR family regulator